MKTLKAQMTKEKSFLRTIHNSKISEIKHQLNIASYKQLKLLYLIINCVVEGHIHISKQNFSELQKRRKLTYLKDNFGNKKQIQSILREKSREKLLTPLYKLCSILPILLHSIF